jgi:hypothetical protein
MNPFPPCQLPASARRFLAPVGALTAAFLAALFLAALFSLTSARLSSARQLADSALIVHEWGTFTSIAGADGAAVGWLPISPKSDLPAFVEHLRNSDVKGGLRGTVRMETPVIYFYSPRQTTVSVRVSFAKGLITEWFPHATAIRPSQVSILVVDPSINGTIAWKDFTLAPKSNAASNEAFPREKAPSHYYAARETAANSVSISAPSGNQLEKFLFYRGVSSFSPPLSAKALASGQIHVQNNAAAVPKLILFERRGDKLGYSISSLESSATLNTPSTSGTLDSLRSDLEDALVAQGLYRDEAHAMLETWRDSWFEEGSRLFYIVPRAFVDSVLPLSVHPAPGQLTRVFVGRIELVTPATEETVEAALLSSDHETLQKYNRFLEPIVEIMISRHPDPARADHLRVALSNYYAGQFSPHDTPPCDR